MHKFSKQSSKMVVVPALIGLLVAVCAFGGAQLEAKPLNQNQIKFRRLPPKEFSAALGSSITIECEAGGSPPPAIHWLKNGNRIPQNDLDENQLEDGQPAVQATNEVNRIALSATRSRLFIDCASFDDEATYTCVADNAFSRISASTRLNLIRAPGASSENDLLSEEVAALELAAVAAAGPASIKQLATATGEPKSSLSAVPQCLSQRGARSNEPPRIHMWTHNIVEVMKNNVVLYCRSNIKKQQPAAASLEQSTKQDASNTGSGGSGTKKSFVSWTLPDDKLVGADQKDKYEVMDTGDLLIKDLSWSDMGSYVCTVSDEQGSDSVSSFVYPAAVKTTTTTTTNKRAASRLADFR